MTKNQNDVLSTRTSKAMATISEFGQKRKKKDSLNFENSDESSDEDKKTSQKKQAPKASFNTVEKLEEIL